VLELGSVPLPVLTARIASTNVDRSYSLHFRVRTFAAVGDEALALEDGIVYHTYSAYSRGVDGLWGMYQWLDRAPKGRNEDGGLWWKRHDEYGEGAANAQRSTSNVQRRIQKKDSESKDSCCH